MPITVREALCAGMSEEMRLNEDIFVIGEEVAQYNGAYKVTQGMLAEFGEKRVIDSPITEHGFAGLAVGAAFAGLRPIVEFMTFNFAMQAIDQIINSAGKTLYMSGGRIKCSIVFRGPNGSAKSVGAQHSQCFASWYAHCPGLVVIAPYSASDSKGLMKLAIKSDNPVIFLEHEILYGEQFDNADIDDDLEIGKAKVAKEGCDVTIVSFSYGMKFCNLAVKTLQEKYGISAELIDLRTIRPLDIDTIVESVKKTGRLLCVEDGWPFSGIGSEIIAQITENAFDYLDAEPVRVCSIDVPMPYAKNLETEVQLSEERVIDATLKVLNKTKN